MIFMDDVEVPVENMLPNVKGFKVRNKYQGSYLLSVKEFNINNRIYSF